MPYTEDPEPGPLLRGPFRVRGRPSCAVCGKQGKLLHANAIDHLFGTPGSWDVAECTNRRCGTTWLDPFPEIDEIGNFYARYYTHLEPQSDHHRMPLEDQTEGGEIAPVEAAPLPQGWRTLVAMRRRSGLMHLESLRPARLLDVGAGSGAFLVEARAHGWRVRGCDFDVEAAGRAAASGVPVDHGAIEEIGYDDASFDAVTANNVLEHLPDVRASLREIFRVLAPSGKFVSVSPNPGSFLHRRHGADWRGLEIPRHLFLYTPHTLKYLAREAGFRRVLASSSSADLPAMEMESHHIRRARTGGASVVKSVAPWQRRALQVAGLLGSNLGEMTVVICEK